MIQIKEDIAKKCPGGTSFFISFPYNDFLVQEVKKCDGANYNPKNKEWEIPISELPIFIDAVNIIDDIEVSFLEQKDQLSKEIELSDFKTNPFNYQKDGIKYGLQHDKWLLLDPPGLGKTLQVLYIAEELKRTKNIEHCLIICGVNTLKSNWKKEIEKHSKLTGKILGERLTKKGTLQYGGIAERLKDLKNPIEEFFIITNIETLRNKDIIKELNSGSNKFDMIILDEAHCCKTPTAIQTKNFLKLKAPYQIALTGTLLVNSPLDAYVPLKWIGKELCNYTSFRYYYVKYGGYFKNEILGYKHLDIFKDMLDSCSLRRSKTLLNLPPRTLINEYVDMDGKQENFYSNIVQGIVSQVDKVSMSTSSILASLIRLRQATACPSILSSEDIPSAKIDRCLDLVEQIISNNEKVVVFSTFKETLNILNQKLRKYSPLLCTGDIKDSIISQHVDEFQSNPNKKLLLATWSKMGTGITLSEANNVIFIDTPYTQAGVEQAIDRCYRIGSSKPLFVYFLMCKNTVDEKVFQIVSDKELISDYVLDDVVSPSLAERLRSIILDL